MLSWSKIWLFCCFVGRRFYEDGCMYRASALAFTTILSVVPLMAVSLGVMTAFPVFRHVGKDVQDFIFNHFVASSGKLIQAYLTRFVEQAGHLSAPGLAALIVAAVLMMFTLEKTLNDIWRVRQPRHGVSAFLMYWAVLTVAPILMGTSIIITSYLSSLPIFADAAANVGLHKGLLKFLPWLLATVVFTLFYTAIPNCKVRFRYGLLAGLCAATVFEILKRCFVIYLANFPGYQLLYGAFATLPIFLIWIYVCWLIILLGAELCYAMSYHYQAYTVCLFDPFTQAFRWLGHLRRAQMQGKALSIEALLACDGIGGRVSPEEQREAMLAANLIQPVAHGCFVIARDLSQFTFQALREALPWRVPTVAEVMIVDDAWSQQLKVMLNSISEKTRQESATLVAHLYGQPQ